jgi:hypothetical protein
LHNRTRRLSPGSAGELGKKLDSVDFASARVTGIHHPNRHLGILPNELAECRFAVEPNIQAADGRLNIPAVDLNGRFHCSSFTSASGGSDQSSD